MGKHERAEIEHAEIIVVKLLNDKPINSEDEKNSWIKHAIALSRQIKIDFPSLTSAEHLGNRYDNTGDILIRVKGIDKFIELKMSDTKEGTGTKANLSQNALTENDLFKGEVKSWSMFRQENGHNERVNALLNRFEYYPDDITKITSDSKQKESKARFLRDSARQETKTKNIMAEINSYDKQIKIDYLTYLSKQKQSYEIIKRFYLLVELGIHRKEEMKKIIHHPEIISQTENLIIYYANLNNNEIDITQENIGKKIKETLKDIKQFKIIFPKKVTHCRLVGVRADSSIIPLLVIVLHWKNVAQGIKTPCLNIFD